jgi:hypothetical protein
LKSLLNELFDLVFCINLDSRTDRWEIVRDRSLVAGLEVERFSAFPSKPPRSTNARGEGGPWKEAVKACARSHIAAVREAVQRGAHSVFIFQDDVVFHPRFDAKLRNWIVDLPEDWDLLYLGGWHPRTERDPVRGEIEITRPEHVSGNVYRLHHDFCLHAVGIKSSVFEDIMRINPESGEPMDCSFVRLLQRHRNCFGLMTEEESRSGAWGLVQQDHSLGSDLRATDQLDRFEWPGWPNEA